MSLSLLEISLLEWLGKFNINSVPCASLHDLYDGVLISSFVQQYLGGDANLGSVPCSEEWLVRKEFWLKILETIARFIVKSMGSLAPTVDEQIEVLSSEVDVEALARLSDTKPLVSLLELILACSVHCKLKENCVLQVLQLRKDQQQVLMESIQRFKVRHLKSKSTASAAPSTAASSTIDYKEQYQLLKTSREQLQAQLQAQQKSNSILGERNSELANLVTQLEAQMATLTVDYKKMKAEMDLMSEKQQNAKPAEIDLTSPMRFVASSKVASEENAQLRMVIGGHEKTIGGLQQQLSSLSSYVGRVRELEDEVEMLKEKSRSADQLERVTRKLEAKSTELATVLQKSKQMEENLEALQKTSSEHELNAKQVAPLKAKLEQYKAEIVQLHSQLAEASVSQDTRQGDAKALATKFEAATIQLEHQKSIITGLEREKEELLMALRARPTAASTAAPIAHLESKSSSSNLLASQSSSGSQKISIASETRSTLSQQLRGVKGKEATEQLEKDLAAAKEEKEVLKMDLEDKLDTMERLKSKFQADYVSGVDQLRSVQGELTAVREALKETECKLADSLKVGLDRDALKTQVGELESQVGTLETRLKAMEVQKEETCAKLVSVESAFEQEKAQWQSQLKQYQSKSAQSVEDGRRMSAELQALKEEIETSHSRLEALSTELAASQDVVLQLNAEVDELKHEKAQLNSDMANFELETQSLEETLKTFMDRELEVVERSHALENEVENLKALVESRDAELTVMQEELERAKANEALLSVIQALRTQIISQHKQIALQKEETRAIVASYHRLGTELLTLKMGGLPKATLTQASPAKSMSFAPQRVLEKSGIKASPLKRIPLKEKTNQVFSSGLIPNAVCAETNPKARRMTMAQKALENRSRTSLAAAALSKR